MEWLKLLPAEWQNVAAGLFVIGLTFVGLAARMRGTREGPPKAEVKEFAMTGQFADMTPLKDLAQAVRWMVGVDKAPEGADLATLPMLLAVIARAAQADAELRDLLAMHLAELRTERERLEAAEDLEERAKELAVKMVAAMKAPRRRAVPKRAPS